MTELLLTQAIRRIEAAAMADLPPGTLMTRAAEAVAEETAALARSLAPRRPIVALVGPGNNGGDALLAAMRLREHGFAARAVALPTANPAPGDASEVRARADAASFPVEPVSALRESLAQARAGVAAHVDGEPPPIVIDGLFGIGLHRALDGDAAWLCGAIRERGWPVVAVDVPSGIDAERGSPVGGRDAAAMRARATVTMIADKPGLHTGAALDRVGTVTVAALGIDAALREAALAGIAPGDAGRLFGDDDARQARMPARERDSNKGDYGSVLCFGGAPGMRGAALLAARGAQAMGAGKVFVGTPVGEIFDPGQPQLMTAAADTRFAQFAAVAIGCGLGDSPAAIASLSRAIAEARALVVDADALNGVAADPALALALRERSRVVRCIVTPHPLEAARLLGADVATVQSDRRAAALSMARALGAVVVLKGAGTVVATPDGSWTIVASGTPALASAGTGDVLAGMAASLLARGLPAERAACLAAWLHGRAAERWETATGLAEGLSAAELPSWVRDANGALARIQENSR